MPPEIPTYTTSASYETINSITSLFDEPLHEFYEWNPSLNSYNPSDFLPIGTTVILYLDEYNIEISLINQIENEVTYSLCDRLDDPKYIWGPSESDFFKGPASRQYGESMVKELSRMQLAPAVLVQDQYMFRSGKIEQIPRPTESYTHQKNLTQIFTDVVEKDKLLSNEILSKFLKMGRTAGLFVSAFFADMQGLNNPTSIDLIHINRMEHLSNMEKTFERWRSLFPSNTPVPAFGTKTLETYGYKPKAMAQQNIYCTYTKYSSSLDKLYAGRTYGRNVTSCIAVANRDKGHSDKIPLGYGPAILDTWAVGRLPFTLRHADFSYMFCRGRENRIILAKGGPPHFNDQGILLTNSGNKIWGIARPEKYKDQEPSNPQWHAYHAIAGFVTKYGEDFNWTGPEVDPCFNFEF